ncbi:hypothetical protein BASA62_006688 [Batrachochytrium salamandrivorans]|nr:hypothetical protein BASA62_006688 [Batrachochytrium salamandrivorans]
MSVNFQSQKTGSQKWKQRNNVQSYKISGESGNVDLAGAEQWKSSLTTMFTGYDLRNVFNMDETGFFYLDGYFKRKGHKVLLFLDNAPVHIVDEATDLTDVELCYSPPNLTPPQFFSLLMLALSKV